MPLHGFQHVVLRKFPFDDRHRQARAVKRHIQLIQHIGDRTDMVVMPMRNEKAFYLICVLF